MKISIRLLGNLEITNAGGAVQLESKKARALVAFLATEHEHAHSRSRLAALFWPDLTPARAKQNLRQVLSNIRKQFGDRVREQPVLLVTRQSVQWNVSADCWVDVQVLPQKQAVYRGDFLTGFTLPDALEFDEWLLLQRERQRQTATRVIQKQLAEAEAGQNLDEAIALTQRWLEVEAWQEQAHQKLMRLLVAMGDRAGALAQFEHCQTVLREQLGVEVSAETTALYQSLLLADSTPSLPAPTTTFVGRSAELDLIHQRLAQPECRLLTLLGQGGIGKTRLAIEAASNQHSYLHGVTFVGLAAIDHIDDLPSTIAAALGLTLGDKEPPRQQLLRHLRDQEKLLILDNFEQLVAGRDLVAHLLTRCPKVKLLVTSRTPLNLHAEWRLPIRGLPFPDNDESADVTTYDAVQLFLRSASRVDPWFQLTATTAPHVARLCRLVAGLPLGIELATSWLDTLSCATIADKIARTLDLLATTAPDLPDRHRSIRALFDHSLDLMSAAACQAVVKLAVCRGGFEWAAAQALGIERAALAELVRHALLRQQADGRYTMHPLLRQYSAEQLTSNPLLAEKTALAHSDYFLDFLTQRKNAMRSATKQTLGEIQCEFENVRAAWQWCLTAGTVPKLNDPIRTFHRFYEYQGRDYEASIFFERAIDHFETRFSQPTGAVARMYGLLLSRRGWYAFRLGDDERAERGFTQSIAVLRPLNVPNDLAIPLGDYSLYSIRRGDHERAAQLLEEAVAIRVASSNRAQEGNTRLKLGMLYKMLGDFSAARTQYTITLQTSRAINNKMQISRALNNLGALDRAEGAFVSAETHFQETLALAQEINDTWQEAVVLNNLGGLYILTDQLDRAETFLQTSLGIFKQQHNPFGQIGTLNNLGQLALRRQDGALAEENFLNAIALAWEAQHLNQLMDSLNGLARVCLLSGDLEQAAWLAHTVRHHSATTAEGREESAEILAQLPPTSTTISSLETLINSIISS